MCWIWPECVPLWNVWQQLQTQWHITAMGQRAGLDYGRITQWLRARGYGPGRQRNLRRALDALQSMEAAVLSAQAQQQAHNTPSP